MKKKVGTLCCLVALAALSSCGGYEDSPGQTWTDLEALRSVMEGTYLVPSYIPWEDTWEDFSGSSPFINMRKEFQKQVRTAANMDGYQVCMRRNAPEEIAEPEAWCLYIEFLADNLTEKSFVEKFGSNSAVYTPSPDPSLSPSPKQDESSVDYWIPLFSDQEYTVKDTDVLLSGFYYTISFLQQSNALVLRLSFTHEQTKYILGLHFTPSWLQYSDVKIEDYQAEVDAIVELSKAELTKVAQAMLP